MKPTVVCAFSPSQNSPKSKSFFFTLFFPVSSSSEKQARLYFLGKTATHPSSWHWLIVQKYNGILAQVMPVLDSLYHGRLNPLNAPFLQRTRRCALLKYLHCFIFSNKCVRLWLVIPSTGWTPFCTKCEWIEYIFGNRAVSIRESNHLTAAAMKDFGLFFFRFQFERNISVCIWQEMPSSGGWTKQGKRGETVGRKKITHSVFEGNAELWYSFIYNSFLSRFVCNWIGNFLTKMFAINDPQMYKAPSK